MAEALIKNLEGAMEEIKKLIDMTGDQVRVIWSEHFHSTAHMLETYYEISTLL